MESSPTPVLIIYWSFFAFINIFLLNFLLRAQWLNILFRKIDIFETTHPKLSGTQSKINEEHETAKRLRLLIQNDGAGSWPPRASHGASWPPALRPYHDVYIELEGLLSGNEVSLDEKENMAKVQSFRAQMQKLLHERVDLPAVEAILSTLESGSALPLQDLNGFFACISLSRHAFRWATIPIVKFAQQETVVAFPRELNVPWENYLSRYFDVKSKGGNVTSNYLCNFDGDGKLVYQINSQMSETIKRAEYHFAACFPKMEKEALGIYHNMVASITHYENGRRDACLEALHKIDEQMRAPLKIYYETLVEAKISREVWMPYVQGFQGWAAGIIDPVTKEYVEYDGLSGNQLPMSFFTDAFLGFDPYLTEENMLRYIPVSQRRLRESLSAHSFREKAKLDGDAEIEEGMLKIVKHMRVFRSAHRARVTPYLSIPAPERFVMTAGKSVLESDAIPDVEKAIEFLDNMLEERFKETV